MTKLETIYYKIKGSSKIYIERPEGIRFLKFLYYHPLGKLTLFFLVKRKIISRFCGFFFNRGISKYFIKSFVYRNDINILEAKKTISEFKTFNDFFIRELKPEARIIEDGLVSPCDGKVLGFNSLNELPYFFIKGHKFNLKKFLHKKDLAKKFENYSLFIFRLSPLDYHRFHFPYEGLISKSKKIKKNLYSVSPVAIKKNIKFLLQNKREYSILKTKNYGDILISEIGALFVGSIIQKYKKDSFVKKGQEKGYFKFGGSSIVMLVNPEIVYISKEILKNTKEGYETFIKFGQKLEN